MTSSVLIFVNQPSSSAGMGSQLLFDEEGLAQEMGQGVIHIPRHFLDRLLLEKAEIDRGLGDDELQMIPNDLLTLGQNGVVRDRVVIAGHSASLRPSLG